MNGFISKVTMLYIVFSSVMFLGSFTYAANTTAEAGCMGCHQGETTAVNEPMSGNNQRQQDQKTKDSPEASKHAVQQG